tara:strand:- start:1961 stop:2476 length:516 start_codon:yes stop_codon:yes gene_type:complete
MFSQLKDNFIRGKSFQPKFSNKKITLSFIGSFIAIFLLGIISIQQNQTLLIAPFGASTVLLFGISNSPLAQPRNLILGNIFGAISAVLSVKILGLSYISCAIAVSIAISLGQIFRCLHPPAGAIAVLGVISNAKMLYVITPVLTGSILLLILAIMFNKIFKVNPSYPIHWF